MNTKHILPVTRHLLQLIGGFLIAAGLMSESESAVLVDRGTELIGALLSVGTLVWMLIERRRKPIPPAVMVFVLAALSIGLGGCARFTTKQTDLSYDDQGNPTRSVTTKATAWTLIEGKSALASFKATQTDKSQSASVGSLNQESSALSTNTVASLNALLQIVQALK